MTIDKQFKNGNRQEIETKFRSNLNRSNDDIVNGDEDELDEKSNKSHDNEPNCGTKRNLREL